MQPVDVLSFIPLIIKQPLTSSPDETLTAIYDEACGERGVPVWCMNYDAALVQELIGAGYVYPIDKHVSRVYISGKGQRRVENRNR